MDKTFLDYYAENLYYLRNQGVDFAREFPKIAARLEISENECADPFVERLLEGAAFLAARVERKLDECMPDLLESIISCAIPQVLDVIPAFSLMELSNLDRSSVMSRPVLPEGTRFDAMIEGVKTPCSFTTMFPMDLMPVQLQDAQYLTLNLENYGLNADAGLYLNFLRTDDVPLSGENNDLLLYLDLPANYASELQQQLQTTSIGVFCTKDGQTKNIPNISFSIPLLDRSESAKYTSSAAAHAKRFRLINFSMFQNGYHFIKIHGFVQMLKDVKPGETFKMVVAFNKRNVSLQQVVEKKSLRMNCIPVQNLFEKKSDRIPIEMKNRLHLVVDRMHPLDYEISRVLGISVYNVGNQKLVDLHRLYDEDFFSEMDENTSFFSVHREMRLRGSNEKRHSPYLGSEIYVSFSGNKYRQIQAEAVQFSATLFCTNRDLPLLLHRGSTLRASGACVFRNGTLLLSPTIPSEPILNSYGEDFAEKVSLFSVNFSEYLWRGNSVPIALLQKILHLYLPHDHDESSGLDHALIAMKSDVEMFRFVRHGQAFFESGLHVNLTIDESACSGVGSYVFGCFLREILRNFTQINIPLKISLETKQRGRITEWMI